MDGTGDVASSILILTADIDNHWRFTLVKQGVECGGCHLAGPGGTATRNDNKDKENKETMEKIKTAHTTTIG